MGDKRVEVLLVVMRKIAACKGVEVCAEPSSYYSFFSSPYIAHKRFAAVDIYPGVGFGDTAFSPVSGRVHEIKKFNSPALGESLPEYLLLIESNGYLVRILHVRPDVGMGEWVEVGDPLGSFISSGYFSFFVDPHVHLEVRSFDDYVRASGGFELEPVVGSLADARSSLSGRVVKADERNVVVALDGFNLAEVSGERTLLDGFSSVGYGGVLGCFDLGEEVFFSDVKIGAVSAVGKRMSIFAAEELSVCAGGVSFAGASFMFNSNLVMLVPERYGVSGLKVGESLKIDLYD